MTIPQRILLHVAVGAGLTIAVTTVVTYSFVYRHAKERELRHLSAYVTERGRREELGFRQIEANLALVRGKFLKRMESGPPRNLDAQWNARFELFPDGAWRSRREFADSRKFSTLWARQGTQLTPELQTQALRAKDICDELLPGWGESFPSVYFIFPGWLNIGFDARLPNRAWDTPANYDPSEQEWFQLALPTNRPTREITWSGVIEEPTTKAPIISVYLPIEKNGQFLGSVGHDLSANRLLEEATRSDWPGAQNVIFQSDGRLIAHPMRQREILASAGQLRMQDSGDPALASLFRAIRHQPGRQFSGYDDGSQFYFSVARLAGPEWHFLTALPREALRRQAFASAQWVLWSSLVSLALLLGFLVTTLRRQIAQPLAELTRATKQMSAGNTSARAEVSRLDELGALAGAFNEMAAKVADRNAALRTEKASLEQRVAERTAELARFASIAEATGDFFGFADLEERLLYINPAGRRMIGLSPDEPPERLGIRDVHPAHAYQQIRETMLPVGLREGSCFAESALRHRDGREIPVSMMLVIPRTDQGEPMFISAIMSDISARKEAEARTRALYESLSAAVTVQDETGFLQINSASLRLFGANCAAEILGKHPSAFSAPTQPDGENSDVAARRHMERAFAHGTERFEWLARRLDGTEFPVEVTLTALQLEGRPVLQAVIIDLTERRRAEAELQNALAKERELSQLKSEFVSLVSHEFRTPLEVILSSADNLRRYHARLEPAKREQLLRTIHKSVRRMSSMMDEVLVLGRLETERMTFDPAPLSLPALCRRICEEIDSATGHRCVIDLQTAGVPELARGDESLLRHIFSNLLSNAVKYSPEQARVEFSVRQEGVLAICQVTDRGCGIPAADQKRLFQAFHRGSNVGPVAGTGLGLLIVQRCVALHGGEMEFASAEGEGTVFTVRLPLFAPTTPTT